MYKRDQKLNGYFINYFVVTLWEMEMTKSQCKAAVPRDWENRDGSTLPAPRRDGRILASSDTPCPK